LIAQIRLVHSASIEYCCAIRSKHAEPWRLERLMPLAVSESVPAPFGPDKFRYVLVMPVWGEHHTGLFLRYCVPFLLTDGNIGAFPDRGLQVYLASRRVDFARMRQDRSYQRLGALTKLVEIEIDDIIDLTLPYQAMTRCYMHALQMLAVPERTVTFFPTPDCILSRDALRAMKRRIEAGARAVMMCGLRVELESVAPLLGQIIASTSGTGSLSERALSALGLRHLHPISKGCDAASSEFLVGCPAHVYWIAPDHSWLLAHCFHLHPMAVRGVPTVIDPDATIDGDYLLGLGLEADQCYICQNSDELLALELSPKVKRIDARTGRLAERHLSRFSAIATNTLHRDFFTKRILFRGAQEPEIPPDVTLRNAAFVEAVKQGPKVIDSLIGFIFWIIRRNRHLRAAARSVVRMGRRLAQSARSELAPRS
jgi:hypothetical protein